MEVGGEFSGFHCPTCVSTLFVIKCCVGCTVLSRLSERACRLPEPSWIGQCVKWPTASSVGRKGFAMTVSACREGTGKGTLFGECKQQDRIMASFCVSAGFCSDNWEAAAVSTLTRYVLSVLNCCLFNFVIDSN